jgi:hypothetical protein
MEGAAVARGTFHLSTSDSSCSVPRSPLSRGAIGCGERDRWPYDAFFAFRLLAFFAVFFAPFLAPFLAVFFFATLRFLAITQTSFHAGHGSPANKAVKKIFSKNPILCLPFGAPRTEFGAC